MLVDAFGDRLHLRFGQVADDGAGDLVVGPIIGLEAPFLLLDVRLPVAIARGGNVDGDAVGGAVLVHQLGRRAGTGFGRRRQQAAADQLKSLCRQIGGADRVADAVR